MNNQLKMQMLAGHILSVMNKLNPVDLLLLQAAISFNLFLGALIN